MKMNQIGGVKSIPLSAMTPELWRGGTPLTPSVIDLYETVPWLHRGVNLVAQTLARMPMAFHRKDTGEELDPVALVKLDAAGLRLPRLMDELAGHIWLFGAGYVVAEANRFSVIKSLRTLHPSTIRPDYDTDYGLKGYIRTVTRQTPYKPDELCAIWLPNRRAEIGPGTSPVYAALKAAGVLGSLDDFGGAYFSNGAIYPTLISLDPSAQQVDVDRMRDWYKRVVTSVKNAFRLEVVRGEVKTTSVGYPVKDLAVPELTTTKREDVATALGIPQTLLFSNAANYATAGEDTIGFYDRTIIPLGEMIAAALNDYLFGKLGITLQLHPERLEVFQRMETEKASAVALLYTSGIMGLGEVRQKMDLPPEPPPDLEGKSVVDPANQVFGYHVELGVVTKNEAREKLGLQPVDEAEDTRLKTLQGKLVVMQAAVSAGVPPYVAAGMVGIDIPSDNSPSEMSSDHIDETVKMVGDWRKWERMAARRVSEGKRDKALKFESAHIPASLAAAVRGCLTLAESADDVRLVFADGEA